MVSRLSLGNEIRVVYKRTAHTIARYQLTAHIANRLSPASYIPYTCAFRKTALRSLTRSMQAALTGSHKAPPYITAIQTPISRPRFSHQPRTYTISLKSSSTSPTRRSIARWLAHRGTGQGLTTYLEIMGFHSARVLPPLSKYPSPTRIRTCDPSDFVPPRYRVCTPVYLYYSLYLQQ